MWESVIIYFKHVISRKEQYNSCYFCCKKKQKLQCSCLVKTFEFVCYCFYCLTSVFFGFVLFCFCETSFDVFTIFSELSRLKWNVLFMEIYIPMKSSIISLTKYAIFYVKKKKKKVIFQLLTRGLISPIFLLFWVQICINCPCLREN